MLRKYFTFYCKGKPARKKWLYIFWSIRRCHVCFYKLYQIQKQLLTGILQNCCYISFWKKTQTYLWWSTMLVKLQTFPQFYRSRTLPWIISWISSKIFRTAIFIQHLWTVASWCTLIIFRVNVRQECEDM